MPAFTYPNPQPTAGVLTFDDNINESVYCDVYTKARWADAWTENNKLICTDVNWAASPTISTATLRYRYGAVIEIGATAETLRARLTNVNGYYVKIVVHCTDGDRVWHGFVDDVADEIHGVVTRIIDETPTPEAAGVQTLSCVGMLAALDRCPINRTTFQVSAGFSISGSDNWRVAFSAPLFNVAPRGKRAKVDKFGNEQLPATRRATQDAVPNFTTNPTPPTANARNAYRFAFPGLYGIPANTTVNTWKLPDVLQHLVCYCAPRSNERVQSNEFVPVWIFDPATLAAPLTQPVPDWVEPLLDCEGLSLKGALDRLLNHERGLGYAVFVDETATPHRLYIEPYTTLQGDATVSIDGTTRTLRQNNRQLKIVQATDVATALTIQQNAATNYTAIEIFGAPEITVCTLQHSAHFVQGWPAALETEYNAEIAALDPNILRDLYQIRDIREKSQYRPIGRNFNVLSTWNWKLNTTDDLFQALQVSASTERYLPFGLRARIMDDLPLKQGVDYSADNTAGDVVTAHAASKNKYRPAEVYAKSFAPDGTFTGKKTCWTTKAIRDVVYDLNDPNYYLQASELENEISVGLAVEVVNGYQGALAAGGGRVAPHVPKLDPAELSYTVAIVSDRELQGRYSIGTPSGLDAAKRKRFDFGDRLQRIRVLANTIVGVDPATDTYKKNAAEMVIRDDSWTMTTFGFLLSQYYSQARNILRIASRRPSAKLWPGQLITKTDEGTPIETPIGAVVSEVSISMPIGFDGKPSRPTFTVTTSRGELDPLVFFPAIGN